MKNKNLLGFVVYLCLGSCAGIFLACSTERIPLDTSNLGAAADSPALSHPGTPLVPQASFYTGNTPAIIRHLEPGKAAEKAGLQPGDLLVRLNGKKFLSAALLERELKSSPKKISVVLKRGETFKMLPVVLDETNPRLGASFEPEGVALRKQNSPFIAYMRVKDMTAYVQTSLNDVTKELHLNIILRSSKTIPLAHMSYSVSEKGEKAALGSGTEMLDALGSNPHFIHKTFKKDESLKGPLLVSFNIERRHFQFEFR